MDLDPQQRQLEMDGVGHHLQIVFDGSIQRLLVVIPQHESLLEVHSRTPSISQTHRYLLELELHLRLCGLERPLYSQLFSVHEGAV